MTHTPGPWEVRRWRHTSHEEWPATRTSIASNGRAIVISPRYPAENFEDDARLIAAAPDLLEASMQLRRAIQTERDHSLRRKDVNDAIWKLDAAIAKATGESA